MIFDFDRPKNNVLNEGGKAIKTSEPIRGDLTLSVANQIISILKKKYPQTNFAPLGSTGKKGKDQTSGDLDIAIELDYSEAQNVEQYLKGSYPDMEVNYLKGFHILSIGFPYQTPEGDNKIVQCDLMFFPNIRLAQYFYWSPDFTKGESKFKGLVRNMLMLNILKNIPVKDKQNTTFENGHPKDIYKYSFQPEKGLVVIHQSYEGKKGQENKSKHTIKDDTQVVSTDTDKITEFMMGQGATFDTISSFEKMVDWMKSDKFPYGDKLQQIWEDFYEYIDNQNPEFSQSVRDYIGESNQNGIKESVVRKRKSLREVLNESMTGLDSANSNDLTQNADKVFNCIEYTTVTNQRISDIIELISNWWDDCVEEDVYENGKGYLYLKDGCDYIGGWTFAESGLETIILPTSVKIIGDYAFKNCRALKSIVIPNSVTTIKQRAFEDCDSLKSITIPNSVTSIAENAFWFCSGLTSITLPSFLTNIKRCNFPKGCKIIRKDVNESVDLGVDNASGADLTNKADNFFIDDWASFRDTFKLMYKNSGLKEKEICASSEEFCSSEYLNYTLYYDFHTQKSDSLWRLSFMVIDMEQTKKLEEDFWGQGTIRPMPDKPGLVMTIFLEDINNPFGNHQRVDYVIDGRFDIHSYDHTEMFVLPYTDISTDFIKDLFKFMSVGYNVINTLHSQNKRFLFKSLLKKIYKQFMLEKDKSDLSESVTNGIDDVNSGDLTNELDRKTFYPIGAFYPNDENPWGVVCDNTNDLLILSLAYMNRIGRPSLPQWTPYINWWSVNKGISEFCPKNAPETKGQWRCGTGMEYQTILKNDEKYGISDKITKNTKYFEITKGYLYTCADDSNSPFYISMHDVSSGFGFVKKGTMHITEKMNPLPCRPIIRINPTLVMKESVDILNKAESQTLQDKADEIISVEKTLVDFLQKNFKRTSLVGGMFYNRKGYRIKAIFDRPFLLPRKMRKLYCDHFYIEKIKGVIVYFLEDNPEPYFMEIIWPVKGRYKEFIPFEKIKNKYGEEYANNLLKEILKRLERKVQKMNESIEGLNSTDSQTLQDDADSVFVPYKIGDPWPNKEHPQGVVYNIKKTELSILSLSYVHKDGSRDYSNKARYASGSKLRYNECMNRLKSFKNYPAEIETPIMDFMNADEKQAVKRARKYYGKWKIPTIDDAKEIVQNFDIINQTLKNLRSQGFERSISLYGYIWVKDTPYNALEVSRFCISNATNYVGQSFLGTHQPVSKSDRYECRPVLKVDAFAEIEMTESVDQGVNDINTSDLEQKAFDDVFVSEDMIIELVKKKVPCRYHDEKIFGRNYYSVKFIRDHQGMKITFPEYLQGWNQKLKREINGIWGVYYEEGVKGKKRVPTGDNKLGFYLWPANGMGCGYNIEQLKDAFSEGEYKTILGLVYDKLKNW